MIDKEPSEYYRFKANLVPSSVLTVAKNQTVQITSHLGSLFQKNKTHS